MVDLDGKFEYSPVVSVQFNERMATAINAYPNPFSNNVTLAITSETAATAKVLVVDLMGRTAEFTNSAVAAAALFGQVVRHLPKSSATRSTTFTRRRVSGHGRGPRRLPADHGPALVCPCATAR